MNNPFETLAIELSQVKHKLDILISRTPEPTPPKKQETFLSVPEVCEMLGITATTLWSWDKKGITKPQRFGNLKRYRLSEIEAIGK